MEYYQQSRLDSLSTIRLLAALHVAFNHASVHLNLSGFGIDLIEHTLGFFYGIPIFFTLSGYLIWMSIGRANSFMEYAQKRFLRIYPELWVSVLVEIAVLLLLFKGVVNWPLLGVFAIGQATIFPFWCPDFLRGYGCGTPNGALWSIFALMQFYLLAYPMYHYLHRRKCGHWAIALVALVALSVAYNLCRHLLPVNFSKLIAVSFIPTFWMFILGAFLAEYKDVVLPKLIKYWYVPVLLRILDMWVRIPELPVYHYGFFRSVFCCLSVIALAYKFSKWDVPLDVSYGVYIYHMTVVNAMISLGFAGGGVEGYLICIIITLLFAYLSTKTIGAWCKRKKKLLIAKEH